MKKSLLIILIAVVVVAGVAGFYIYQNNSGRHLLGGDRDEHGCIGSAGYSWCEVKQKCLRIWEEKCETAPPKQSFDVPEPPAGKVAVYKGFWMPAGFYYDHNGQSMMAVASLKDAGANIASIGPNVKINAKGEVKFDTPMDYVEQSLAYWAKEYYSNNIRISLVLEVFYEEEFSGASGEPKPIPASVASQPHFLDKYNLLVVDMAKLAQKYKVEIFSPMNEPDLKLGEATANTWAQTILPLVRANYSGKILWKAAGGALDKYNTNFQGYDIIGFDPSPGGGPFEQSMATYRQVLNNLLTIAKARAQRDNVPEIMITEFGVWGGALSFTEDQKVLAHRAVFEAAQGKVSGFFALDPPSDLDRGLAGTKTLTEIKTWFKEKL